jgi:hypothetical protein
MFHLFSSDIMPAKVGIQDFQTIPDSGFRPLPIGVKLGIDQVLKIVILRRPARHLLFGYKSSADEESSLSNSKVYVFADLRQN